MPEKPDDDFFGRADAHIRLSNEQVEKIGRGKVSASMMYATARFNAWLTATNQDSGASMLAGKAASIDYFVGSYRAMLEENFDEYIANFEAYMKPGVN